MNINLARQIDTMDVYELNDVIQMRDNSPHKRQLEEIRQLSNIIQALENLVVQCEGVQEFCELQLIAKTGLSQARKNMSKLIHFD
jgi:hypothetical protein